MNWYLQVLKKYVVFSGRARRKEFWMYMLINYIIWLALIAIEVGVFTTPPILSMIYTLAVVLPGLAVTVRRLHDTDRSGFWCFISAIPFVGGIILLIFLCQNGTSGANRYGSDPKLEGSELTLVEKHSLTHNNSHFS